ncbi:hypothetical protein C8F01DRAFT_1375908 [Mycena amicta]|nr:hypothetical protein C8F01DRAFT_1375908 [Mycena amicta]
MADRYPMLPNGFSPAMHQQQMAQSHLNQSQEGHAPVAGFPDQWQQMQQIQNQFRPQSAGLDPSHVNPQVQEMMRNQQLARQGHPFLDQQPNSFQNSIQSLNSRFQQPSNPEAHRQLELLGLAHNQQPQNGPVNFANRMHQQAALNGQRIGQQPQQPQQPETFLAAPGPNPMRQPSPSHQQGQPPAPQQGQPAQVTRASYVALQERAHNLKSIISNQEAQLMQLTSQRTRIGDASFMDKVRTVSADLKNRKEHYARLVNFINQIQSHIQHGGGASQNMGGMSAPMSMPPQPSAGPSWMQGPQLTQPPFNQNPGPQNGPAASPPNSHLSNYSPRPGPAQQQFSNPMQQPTPSFQPNLAGQQPFPSIPPLDKVRFENVFKSWCTQRNIQLNPRILTIDARSIDLHDLHTQVMMEGGAQVVSQKDLWTTVGGRMGFVQFPASDSEPAKSGPGVAQQLAHAYKEYLAAFDNVYINTVMEQRRKNSANAQHSMGAGIAGPRIPADPTQMQLVMQYANLPTSELRRRGFPEQIVQFVENNRSTLLQNRLEQAKFHEMLAPHSAPQPMQPNNQAGIPPSMAGMNGGRVPAGLPGPPRIMDATGQPPQRPTRETSMVPERMLSNVPPIEIPPEQRMEYNNILEQLHRACMELDHKLPMILAVLKSESVVRRYVIIVQTAIQQRAMITSGSTRFLVTLDTLRNMMNQVQGISENFATILSTLMGKQHPGQGPMQRPPMPNPLGPMPPAAPTTTDTATATTTDSPAPAPTPTPPPVASASTPVHNAPTPRDMASPKSPKGKAAAKPKPAPRRKSIKAPNPPLPIQEPVTAPSPAGSNSNKRGRDEEASPSLYNTSVANEPSPPKRLKTEWEGTPSEAITVRAEQVESVKTEEDSAAFLEQMTELFRMAANDGQDRLTSDFSETLDTILKGFGTSTDESASTIPSIGHGESSGATDVVQSSSDEFVEFFDFSSFGTSEEDDAAPTPDLFSSSSTNPSTNPSPESNAEMDATHQAPALLSDGKSDEFDHLRLGVWREVDGGESAYFNSGQWKWDGSMQHTEQAWAFNS